MTETKQSLVERAKLLEQIEQYDDMAAVMKKVVEMDPVLSNEERDLFSVAYQKVIERRLTVWRILRSIEQKTEGSEQRQQMAKEYREKVQSELNEICADVLGMLDYLITKSASSEDEAQYRAMWHSVNECVAEVAGICHVAKIADKDVQTILKYLPPYKRLIASEVCVKWHGLSAKPWRDIVHLDLSQVPTANIHAVIKKCPNLASISALGQDLGDFSRFVSRLGGVVSLKCVDCSFTFPDSTYYVLCDQLREAPLQNLVWRNSRVCLSGSEQVTEHLMPLAFSSTLRRLELVALRGNIFDYYVGAFTLPLLESVIMADLKMPPGEVFGGDETDFLFHWSGANALEHLEDSASLRELYLDGPDSSAFIKLVFALPSLEMLFVNNVSFVQQHIERLMTQHGSLRVLVLTASRESDFDGEVVIPVRNRFPNSFNADPVPQLQLFLGKIASQKLRFTPSESDALKISPIDAPLPQFLEKISVKSTFEDSWIASRIRELAENGERLVDYCFEGNAEEILYAQ